MKSNKKSIFSGTCTALITPFKDGKIDYFSFKRMIEFQISEGIDALLVCGTTGEASTLSEEEARDLIRFASRENAKRVPLIAGVGSNDTKKALRLSHAALDSGADALLSVTPYYNKASADGLIRHFEAIADEVDLPLILYNVPSRTGVNIPLSVYDHLANHENIVGVKEASSSISDFARLTEKCADRFDVYSGNDDLLLPTLSLGGRGVISVLSNLLPKEMGDVCRLWFSGLIDEARELQLKLLPLIRAVFSEVNPIPIKALLAHRGLCAEEYRLPLCPLDKAKKEAIIEIAERY